VGESWGKHAGNRAHHGHGVTVSRIAKTTCTMHLTTYVNPTDSQSLILTSFALERVT